MDRQNTDGNGDRIGRVAPWFTVLAACVGIALLVIQSYASSATYDEDTYLNLAIDWWRGRGDATITRMGSPVTFYKLQAAVPFAVLDLIGRGSLIDDGARRQAELLPLVRTGSLWIWAIAFGLTACWAKKLYGSIAMICASWLFVLSPNLLAHGNLMTMELPLVACTTAMFLLFWRFLESGKNRLFVASAAVGGLAFSCKFTTVVIPPILGCLWLGDLVFSRRIKPWHALWRVTVGMSAYLAIMMFANLLVTGFWLLPASERVGDHPAVPGLLARLVEWNWPVDWVGFATQLRHQRNGGPSYLFGERRMTGWWYYYPVALAVKLPISCAILIAAATVRSLRFPAIKRDWLFPVAIALFLGIAMLGSKRNYGVRYLLPLAPLAIVWISGLAQRSRGWRNLVYLGLAGQAIAVFSVFPHELSFFNRAAGGVQNGRHILADSNLDWGQGLRSFARVEERFTPITLFYFGLSRPNDYGVRAQSHIVTANDSQNSLPSAFHISTRYVAVSASLQYGPWGPAGYFRALDDLRPVAMTDDGTIAIYDLQASGQ